MHYLILILIRIHHLGVRLIMGALLAGLAVPSTAFGQERVIDTGHSIITLHVFKSGLFRAFADNHVIQAPITGGSFDDGQHARVQLVVDVQNLRVSDPGLSPAQREQVQSRMLGPDVLDAEHFPQIRFQSTAVEHVKADGWLVRGDLTLRGQTHEVTLNVARGLSGAYRASTSLKQTTFGITPISIAGGTVTVKDEVQIDSDIVAASDSGATH
jgi:polyisoprenoid-binding protein YceI